MSESQSPSGDGIHSVGETWGALRLAWKGYRIARGKNEPDKVKEYAERIKTLQRQLGVKESVFHIGTEQVLIPSDPIPDSRPNPLIKKQSSIHHPISFSCGCVLHVVVNSWGWHLARQATQLCDIHTKEIQQISDSI